MNCIKALLALTICALPFGVAAQTWPNNPNDFFHVATPPASQIAGKYSTWFPNKQTQWVVNPAFTTTAAGSGGAVNFRAAGEAVGRSGGSNVAVKIPSVINTVLTKPNIAAAASKAFTAARTLAGPVGIATTAWSIYNAYKDSGLTVCPPPDFFCAPPGTYVDVHELGWTYQMDLNHPKYENVSISQARDLFLADRIAMNPTANQLYWKLYPMPFGTSYGNGGFQFTVAVRTEYAGGATYTTSLTRAVKSATYEKPGPPLSDADMKTQAQQKMDADATGNKSKTFVDAVFDANEKSQNSGRGDVVRPDELAPNTSATTVEATPVQGPSVQTGQVQFTDSAGVVQTQTTTQQATVTPALQSATGGSSTVINYIISNYVTNVTTNYLPDGTRGPDKVENVIVNDTVDEPPAQQEIPNDYNKEVTQQAVLAELRADSAPTMADQNPRVDDAIQQSKDTLDDTYKAIEDAKAADQSLFYEWLWTPPVGSCSAPSGVVHGYTVTWDICPTVENIRDVLGWLMALMSGLTIYSLLFKSQD